MTRVNAVIEPGAHGRQRPFVMPACTVAPRNLVARRFDVSAVPVVFAECRVGRQRMIPRMRQGKVGFEAGQQKIILHIPRRDVPCFRFALGLTVHDALNRTGLQLLVYGRERSRKEKFISPPAMRNTGFKLCQYRKIIIMETLAVERPEASLGLVPQLDAFHQIIVL